MVSPARKREVVAHHEEVLDVSERRACEEIVQPRSTQRYLGRKRGKDAAMTAELRRISAAHPRAGYRMVTALLRRSGMEINVKRGNGSGGRKDSKCRAGNASGSGLGAAKAARRGGKQSGLTMCGATASSLMRPRTGGGYGLLTLA